MSLISRTLPAKPLAGAIALAFLTLLAGGALFSLGFEASRETGNTLAAFNPYLWRVARFTLWQALLSTALSVGFAIPIARALHAHQHFMGRAFVLRLFALPLALPALVAVLGITSIYGRSGIISQMSQYLGLGFIPDIYGLTGILLAHVFFNLPLAVRFLLTGLDSIPADYWKLSAQLGMGNGARFRLIEWPAIARSLPGIMGLIFMLCVTSFTIVLTLGGGPRATTLEVAIYQALHFDFDIGQAVALTLIQLMLTLAILSAFRITGRPTEEGFSLAITTRRYEKLGTGERLANWTAILLALLFVALPLAGTVVSGLAADLGRLMSERTVWRAIMTSLVLGAAAALFSVVLSLALVAAREAVAAGRKGQETQSFFERGLDTGASLILVVPPIIIGAGWFILLRHFADPFDFAPWMVISVNAAMAMPFAVRLLRPTWDTASARHNRLCAQLGITGWTRLRLIDWPVLRRPLGVAFAFAMALSLGDLGTIALFGSDAVQTLPYLLLQRMGSYRTLDAAGLALILGVLSLSLMMLADRGSQPAARKERSP
ncbi:thiamine/thiamine pyrophosphate ABC transporter, permease protein [Phyllobacterium phragmitis]|uniref:Thiamine transport system permease protein ThiP n=1 Tax=Phyllobacterium phragmitis TaxID=2670329 RepID=A0A2S9ITQ5_9HYPH|nr:thiamine/thiamine pyrophosphate ABC transporter permease [Phyllobacterium phragmitis]PRD43907.1 thiamine/thiamine pyrophosphate ABC transporter, permease protein [Phyllobacterium phragmitis]